MRRIVSYNFIHLKVRTCQCISIAYIYGDLLMVNFQDHLVFLWG